MGDPNQKRTEAKKGWECGLSGRCLPRKLRALSLNTRTTKKKIKTDVQEVPKSKTCSCHTPSTTQIIQMM
jgi:hypothetical protein